MITLTTEQAQQIEEALEQLGEFLNAATPSFVDESKSEALSIIRAARAQEQAEQEPVAWALSHSQGIIFSSKYPMRESKEIVEQMARQHMGAVVITPLYAAPVRTKDLTKQEILKAQSTVFPDENYWENCARAVIAADRELNK